MDETEYRQTPAETPEASLLRLLEPAYGPDGAPTPSDVNAATVAFEIFVQGDIEMPNDAGRSALWIFWGQFLDHDLSLTPEQDGEGAEFLKFEGPNAPFNVVRSDYTLEDGTREQPNVLTPLIDASNVYGSDAGRQAALRSFEAGRLETGAERDGILLLTDAETIGLETGEEGFVAGDVRADENPGLTSVHTLWVNEHNYWAGRFAAEDPSLDDEALFQKAREAVEILIQQITYEEFLPLLLAPGSLAPYDGFDAAVDPQITNEFSTAAYRFGHTSVPDSFSFIAEDGSTAAQDLSLFQTFENDAVLTDIGPAALLRGTLEARAQELDTKVVDSLNFLLFTPDGGLSGFSLPERNVLRGRDHGLPGWLEARDALVGDLDAAALAGSTDFSLITSDAALAEALASLYGTLGAVDLWVGGLAEDRMPGGALGPTFNAINAEQFARTRDGDPLFYQGRSTGDADLDLELGATMLSDVLMRSGGIDYVQRDALLASERVGGTDEGDEIVGGEGRELIIGFDGKDRLDGAGGADDLFGGAGDDEIKGGDGDDNANGGDGDDLIMTGAGNDRLVGGNGRDVLIGGIGADVYVIEAGDDLVDRIVGFVAGEDTLELSGFGADAVVTVDDMGGSRLGIEVDGVRVVVVWNWDGRADGMGTAEEDVILLG
ncbi:MAG: peroxidase family protein [Pseudomonadota bacterium]